MKGIYDEYFYVPKHGYGKVREKVLYSRVAVTIGLMVLCLAAMSFVAFAFFTSDISSNSNIIKTATFQAEVSIVEKEDSSKVIEVVQTDKYEKTASIKKDVEYLVTLKKGGEAKTGFCVLSGNKFADVYYTQQLGADINAAGGNTEEIKFYLKADADCDIVFFSHWGTSTKYAEYQNKNDEFYIENNETVDIKITPVVSFAAPEENEPQDESEQNLNQTEENEQTDEPTDETVSEPALEPEEEPIPESEEQTEQPVTEEEPEASADGEEEAPLDENITAE